MRYEQFTSGDISYAYKINTISDVLDLKRFKKRSFNNFKELLKKNTEVEAKKLARDVFVSFLKKLSQDLIVENDIFVFPAPGFGYIKISNTADANREDYVYDIESNGKIWTPRMKLDPNIVKRNKKHYKLRFNEKLRNQMFELIQNGHKYA
jgi:hypothetical protein